MAIMAKPAKAGGAKLQGLLVMRLIEGSQLPHPAALSGICIGCLAADLREQLLFYLAFCYVCKR